MRTIGALNVTNTRSGRLLPGAPVTVTDLDGTPLETYTADDQPAPVVSNHEGHVAAFRVDSDAFVFWVRPRGGTPVAVPALEGFDEAAQVADTINDGRLSETALADTFLPKDDTGAAGLAVLAANLPAEAREVLGITVDTSVGTRVFVGGVMVYGDTGWRDVRPLLINGWTATRLQVRREGGSLTFKVRRLDGTDATAIAFMSLPPGFQPAAGTSMSVMEARTPDAATFSLTASGEVIAVRTGVVYLPDQYVDQLSQPVPLASTWPTALPGVPA